MVDETKALALIDLRDRLRRHRGRQGVHLAWANSMADFLKYWWWVAFIPVAEPIPQVDTQKITTHVVSC